MPGLRSRASPLTAPFLSGLRRSTLVDRETVGPRPVVAASAGFLSRLPAPGSRARPHRERPAGAVSPTLTAPAPVLCCVRTGHSRVLSTTGDTRARRSWRGALPLSRTGRPPPSPHSRRRPFPEPPSPSPRSAAEERGARRADGPGRVLPDVQCHDHGRLHTWWATAPLPNPARPQNHGGDAGQKDRPKYRCRPGCDHDH